jgi:tetratricopeptide (TPR) repeat protein
MNKLRISNFVAAVVFFITVTVVPAQSPDQLMQSANKLYQEQNYVEAISTYEKILSQGFESGALYYNLGNAYFKEGKIGRSILCYERGLKIEPNDEDLAYNLRIANSRTIDKISEVPKLFLISWWEGLVTAFGISGWSILVVLTFWLMLASIAVYFFSRKAACQRFTFMSGSISLSVLVLLIAILFARVNREASKDYGILVEPIYSAKVSPDEKSNDAFVIHEVVKFSMEDEVSGWVKIRLIDGKVGWVYKDAFRQI